MNPRMESQERRPLGAFGDSDEVLGLNFHPSFRPHLEDHPSK